MHSSIAASVIVLAVSVPAEAGGPSSQVVDWTPWRNLPVQDDGRHKPLDTLARETIRKITGKARFADPETGQKLDPVGLYLAMLFDWQGWDRPPSTDGTAIVHPHMVYFESHQADKWDHALLLKVSPLLREGLGLKADESSISPANLSKAKIRDARTGKSTSFPLLAAKLAHTEKAKLSGFERAIVELAERLQTYRSLRMGDGLEVVPAQGSPDRLWLSVAQLMRSDFDDKSDPIGGLRAVKRQFQEARAAYLHGSPQAFGQATVAFIGSVRKIGPQLGIYPRQGIIDLEVAYNRWAPLTLAWWFSAAAILCLVLSMAARRRAFYIAGLAALGVSLVAMCTGLGMRTAVSGWAPVTNLYESVVFVAFGTVIFGLVFGVRSGKQYVLAAAAVVATIALVLADFCPAVLNPEIHPLPPVLRSKFWLAVHVITIMLSYAAFAVALGIGNITLGCFLVGSRRPETIQTQCRLIYQSLKAGVLLLMAGTILGALWADYSWGRFWGWDPKEVWALITLLGYLALLHGRCVGWVGNLGLAAFSVVCFIPVVITWYVVNILGSGLHNYALTGGTRLLYLWGTVGAELVFVAAAASTVGYTRAVSRSSKLPTQPIVG